MTSNELGTMLQYALKVIIIIENNDGCKSISHLGSEVNGEDKNVFKNPDYRKIAEAYNVAGYRVETLE